MKNQKATNSEVKQPKNAQPHPLWRSKRGIALLLSAALAPALLASENVPHRPFAMWADVPQPRQFIVGVVYEESEAYHIWTGHQAHDVTTHAEGESYGID